MERSGLNSMSTDELWRLHEQVVSILTRKIAEEKSKLEQRLRRLSGNSAVSRGRPRRPYPKVLPKYQNPRDPSEKWSGRGKRPRWVRAQLRAGKKLDHFLPGPQVPSRCADAQILHARMSRPANGQLFSAELPDPKPADSIFVDLNAVPEEPRI